MDARTACSRHVTKSSCESEGWSFISTGKFSSRVSGWCDLEMEQATGIPLPTRENQSGILRGVTACFTILNHAGLLSSYHPVNLFRRDTDSNAVRYNGPATAERGSCSAQSVTLGLANWFAICIARVYCAPSAPSCHTRGHVCGDIAFVETHRGCARVGITLGSAHDKRLVSDNFNSLLEAPPRETIDRRRGERAFYSRTFCHDRISI